MPTVSVELPDCGQRNCIDVYFSYNVDLIAAVKSVAGARYVKTPAPHWHVPLDMSTCRALRAAFGSNLQIGLGLKAWAHAATRDERELGSLAAADTAALEHLPKLLPSLYEALHVGPLGLTMTPAERARALTQPPSYQCADVAFMVKSRAPLNGNQPGLGKTLEDIAAIWEAGLGEGRHCIVAPSSAVDGVWEEELLKWLADAPVKCEIFACVGTRARREQIIEDFQASNAKSKWLIVNAEMTRFVKDETRVSRITRGVSGKAEIGACTCKIASGYHEHYRSSYPVIHNTEWTTLTIDECHKGSVRNHRTITAWSMMAIPVAAQGKAIALSGTPMKKKGADIWGTLHFLRPDVFTSYWRFAERYFQIEDNGYGKVVGALLPKMQDAFFQELSPYLLRRTKAECAPWLPPKQFVPVWCSMETEQAALYRAMEKSAAAVLSDVKITANGTLAELTRLRQFATSVCTLGRDGKLLPTSKSCKIDAMLERMDEHGMFDDDSTEKQIVFSQSRELIELVAGILRDRGLKTEIISGKVTKVGERKRIKNEFQNGDTRVLAVVTTAGGVALTLDAADVAHFLDELWSPDEHEQAEDRLHRVSRNHQVTIYNYRTKGTIDQDILETATDKKRQHELILDVRRRILARSGKSGVQ